MNMISIVIADPNRLVCDGIEAMLADVDDIRIADKIPSLDYLSGSMDKHFINILITGIYSSNINDIEKIKKISLQHPGIKILLLTMHEDNDFIFRTMKAGAKGYLSGKSSRRELLEAIYTITSGYDYFSNFISQILFSDYLNKIDGKENHTPSLHLLSEREIEVLRLYGNGLSNKEIADKLFISIRTVESHKNRIMRKLQITTTVDLIKFAIRNNIIRI